MFVFNIIRALCSSLDLTQHDGEYTDPCGLGSSAYVMNMSDSEFTDEFSSDRVHRAVSALLRRQAGAWKDLASSCGRLHISLACLYAPNSATRVHFGSYPGHLYDMGETEQNEDEH